MKVEIMFLDGKPHEIFKLHVGGWAKTITVVKAMGESEKHPQSMFTKIQ